MSNQIINFPKPINKPIPFSRKINREECRIIDCRNPAIWAFCDAIPNDEQYQNLSAVELIVYLSHLAKKLEIACTMKQHRKIPSICAKLALCARALGFHHTQDRAKILGEIAMARRYGSCQILVDEIAHIVDAITVRYFEMNWKNPQITDISF